MADWYYDKEALWKTPSIQDGMDYATETKYRKEGARFILDLGSVLELGYNTWATGVVFFHRFYMFRSFKDFPHYVTACCCLFLAGKVEETPKKCKDIIRKAQSILNEENFKTFGENPKEEVMTLEKILLQTIKFDFKIYHPYSFLTRYAKILKGDKDKLQKMVQMAWTFINDSLCTTLSIQWEPEIVAIALMYLASKLSKFQVINWKGRRPGQTRWWEMYVEDLKMNVIEDICHQVLDLYSSRKDKKKPRKLQSVKMPLKDVKCTDSNQQQLNVASTEIAIFHQGNPLEASFQFAQVLPQQPTFTSTQIALVPSQNSAVSFNQIDIIPANKKNIVNADPRTLKSDTKIMKTKPVSEAPMAIKTEQPLAVYEPSANDIQSLSMINQPNFIKTEPLCIKTELPTEDETLLTNEIPFYNPEKTVPTSFGTPMSTTSTVFSAANLQSSSPSFQLPDFSVPPPTYSLPTSAINQWTTAGDFSDQWKDAQICTEINETDKAFYQTRYPDIYCNNYQKEDIQECMRRGFDDARFRNPDNIFQRDSNRHNGTWDSKSYFRNRPRNINGRFRDRRNSFNSVNSGYRRNHLNSRNFNKKRWHTNDYDNNLKKNLQENRYDSSEKLPDYCSSQN